MSQDDKAAQTRETFVDSVKGKAKEIAGAVTGNDSLTAEGQLTQAEAKERRSASTAEAEADAEAAEAQGQAREAEIKGGQERAAAEVHAAGAESAARVDQAAQRRTVDEAERRDVDRAETAYEANVAREATRAADRQREDVAAAAQEYDEAVDDYRQSAGEAVRKEAQAERLRRKADDPDLP